MPVTNRVRSILLWGGLWMGLVGRGLAQEFPRALVDFVEASPSAVFAAGKPGDWDAKIRERGWIRREADGYHLWYTGYRATGAPRQLGYATSTDAIHWVRHPHNPIYTDDWVEDMMIVKDGDIYHMFAEGKHDVAQRLVSRDKIHWRRIGPLDVRLKNGAPIPPGPYGTPTAGKDAQGWWLLYERRDRGIWLARSPDLENWTHVQDEPVLAPGPAAYDRFAVAVNQVVRHNGVYYAYYHGSDTADWKEWNVNVAASQDLIHWKKYSGNPLLRRNKSSGLLIETERGLELFTMHALVHRHVLKPQSGAPKPLGGRGK